MTTSELECKMKSIAEPISRFETINEYTDSIAQSLPAELIPGQAKWR